MVNECMLSNNLQNFFSVPLIFLQFQSLSSCKITVISFECWISCTWC